jgi:hypothetical protein
MPDASQFTQIKRLQTSAAADQGAGRNKFRAPRLFDGWNSGQLIKFGQNALLSNKFIPRFISRWVVSTFYNNGSVANANCAFVDSTDNVYLGFAGLLVKILPSGEILTTLVGANGMAVGGGFIYATTSAVINRYLASDLSSSQGGSTGFTQINIGGGSARAVALDRLGRILYVNNNNNLIRVDADGASNSVTLTTASDINTSRQMVMRIIGGVEYAYLVEQGANQIIRYNLSAATPISKEVVLTGLNSPRGLAFESDTVLYVTDSGNNRIMRFDTVTNTLTRFAGTGTASSTGNGGDPLLATFHTPSGIAFSNDRKTLYVPEVNSTTRDFSAIRLITEQIN